MEKRRIKQGIIVILKAINRVKFNSKYLVVEMFNNLLNIFQAFQKRYFVLKGNLLFYFERKTDREPIGVIILEGCTIELAEDDQER